MPLDPALWNPRFTLTPGIASGWLVPTTTARRNRAYRLSPRYRQFIGNSSAMTPDADGA